ncbi:MAG: IPT/TIG domain-containing protein, partial [Acidobacteria bacterium]|nr:IPT/TIG domain-containing protein [Acidobacteriota bacterium]
MRFLKLFRRTARLYLALFICLACLTGFSASAGQRWAQLWQRLAPDYTARLGRAPARVFNVITVNTTADENGANSAACSLREAITAANTNAVFGGCPAGAAGLDVIEFNLGTGTPVITLSGGAPTITQAVTIDGATGGATRVMLDGVTNSGNGLDLQTGGCTIRGLVIKRFLFGIRIFNGSGGHTIQNCFIGTNENGDSIVNAGNGASGIVIVNTPNNLIGGDTPGAGNVLAANGNFGLDLQGSPGNTVQGNRIGTDVNGALDFGNVFGGVNVSGAANNLIGGASLGARNIIAGNGGNGVSLSNAGNSRVQGNYIGLTAAGTAALLNNQFGVFVSASNGALIGGTARGEGNVISGNGNGAAGGDGISLQSSGVTVQGNLIGLNAAGTAKVPNVSDGIGLSDATNSLIGGTTAGAGNIIAGNNGSGVAIRSTGSGAGNNVVQGNLIGTNSAGDANLGNASHGVFLTGQFSGSANSNAIGGTAAGAGNVIAFNGGAGVGLSTASTRNAIQGNSIFSNVRRGITLDFNNFPANDPGDGDTGANNRQNFPALTQAAISNGNVAVQGTFNSTANATFRLEFFDSPARHSTGYGEGKTFLGFINVTTDASGNTAFNVILPISATANHFLTATATDANGNTSEFSLSLAPPNVTPQTVAAIPYNSPTRRTIAQVSDFETAAGNLTLALSNVPAGMTVSGLQHDGNGFISALLNAACNLAGSTQSFNLNVTDADNNATSGVVTVGLQPLPTIQFTNNNPTSQTVCVGQQALFGPINVTFSGGAPVAVNFRWRKVGQSNPVSTASQLFFPNATAADAGDYLVEWATECNPSNYQFLEQVSLTVHQPTAATALDNGTVIEGAAASFTTTASGSGPFGFVWKKGAVVLSSNEHLQINSTAMQSTLLIGQTVTGDSDTYSVTVTGACGAVTQSAALTVNPTCVGLTLAPFTLPSGVLGYAYNQTLTASGGVPPYSFSISDGALPPGLALNANGTLSGAPTQVGNFVFNVEASAGACTGSAGYTLSVGQLNLAATGGEGYVDLNWTQAGYSSLMGFKLYRATVSGGSYALAQSLAANASTFRDTGVTPNTAYFYKLTVLDSNGESSFSNPAAATPVAGEPPVITHTPPAAPAAPGVPIPILATVTDNVGVQSVKLFFRTLGAASYTERAMLTGGNNLYETGIQGSEFVVPGVEYYLEARDQSNVTQAGQPNDPYRLTLADRPYLTQLNPANGPAAGGTSVTLTGHNFKANAVVRFDSALATITNQSATQLVCITPPHFPAAVDVRVTNPDGASDVLTRGFIYQGAQAALSLPTTTGPQGVNVQIPINAANVQGLTAADVRVTSNSVVLSAVNVSPGTLTPNWGMQTNLNTPGEVRLALASTTGPISGSGSVAVIEFQVLGAPGAVTPLTLSSVLLNGGAIAATLTAGQFTVAPVYSISGTVSHWNNTLGGLGNVTLALAGSGNYTASSQANGAFALSNVLGGSYTLTPSKTDQTSGISAFDAALVLQHSAGLITLTGAALTAADVDRSGGVNAQDAFYILQQTVGLIGLPFPGAGVAWLFNPVTRSYNNLSADQTNQNFTGMLL